MTSHAVSCRLLFGPFALAFLFIDSSLPAQAAKNCSTSTMQAPGIDVKGDQPLQQVTVPPVQPRALQISQGYPIPDSACIPGAVNPTVTLDVLQDSRFVTGCVREKAEMGQAKIATYDWYGVPHPQNNQGQNQACELKHLISLELGGADTLDNTWPQCGPDGIQLKECYFKIKDKAENYWAREVKTGHMSLQDAQQEIATDWTQYMDAANQ